MDKLSKAIQVLEDQINYSVRNMDEVSVELDFESADVILELLKAQQPRKVVYKTNPWTNLPVSFCPSCDEAIKMYEYGHGFAKRKYCSYCGQAIDWDGGGQE